MRVRSAFAVEVFGYQHLLGQRVTAVDGIHVFDLDCRLGLEASLS